MIARAISNHIQILAENYPVVTIMGPRQSGKTTLVRTLFPNHEYLNVEAEDIRLLAQSDPRSFLRHGTRRLILDEAQHLPSLLTYIQEYADTRQEPGQFIITGSHQPALGAAIGETLAGRTGIAELMPLSLEELQTANIDILNRDKLIYTGFMPRLYNSKLSPHILYRDYFKTYIQRDVRQLVQIQSLDTFTIFVRLLAGRVGQLLNKESLARDTGVSVPTVTNWLNVLEASYVIFRLRPYFNNFGKRQIKTPKIYFTETGLVSYLLGIRSVDQVATHPLIGNLFENLVVSECLKRQYNSGEEPSLWFYRNSSGTLEVDLLFEKNGTLIPREIKSSATYSARMSANLCDFASLAPNIEKPLVVYAGKTFENIAVHYSDLSHWCQL